MGQGSASAFRSMDQRKDKTFNGYNGSFEYEGRSFQLIVTSISHAWGMKTSAGASNTRNRQIQYPGRAEQGDLSISLAFRSVQEYIDFVEFVGAYHRRCVADGVAEFPFLRFRCSGVGAKGCDYVVMPKTSSIKISSSMGAAPTISGMQLMIIRDMLDWWAEQRSSSRLTSSEMVPEGRRVTPQDIKSSTTGIDSAYGRMTASDRRRMLGNRYLD